MKMFLHEQQFFEKDNDINPLHTTCLVPPAFLPAIIATDLEWKVIYVGSAEDTQYDQVLEEVDVGPIPIGVNKFVLTAGGGDQRLIGWPWGGWVGGW